MKVLIYGDKHSNPDRQWVDCLPKDNTYTVYFIPTGNYLNFYDLLTHHIQEGIIEQYDHVVIQSANKPNLCFYTAHMVYHFYRVESKRDNFEFFVADNKQLVWSSNIFDTPIGDEIQARMGTNMILAQKQHLQRLVENNEIESLMKGSEIRLLNLLREKSIQYTLVKDINDENINLRTTR